MKLRLLGRLLCLGALVSSASASRAQVSYSVESLGGSSWEYAYNVVNPTDTLEFDEITIYFEVSTFSSLVILSSPPGWGPLVIQPDPGIPADGYLDVVSPTGFLREGAPVGSFVVSASYSGVGVPGPQHFELYDSSTFILQDAGTTALSGGGLPSIPEPNSCELFAFGIAMLWWLKKSRRS